MPIRTDVKTDDAHIEHKLELYEDGPDWRLEYSWGPHKGWEPSHFAKHELDPNRNLFAQVNLF